MLLIEKSDSRRTWRIAKVMRVYETWLGNYTHHCIVLTTHRLYQVFSSDATTIAVAADVDCDAVATFVTKHSCSYSEKQFHSCDHVDVTVCLQSLLIL